MNLKNKIRKFFGMQTKKKKVWQRLPVELKDISELMDSIIETHPGAKITEIHLSYKTAIRLGEGNIPNSIFGISVICVDMFGSFDFSYPIEYCHISYEITKPVVYETPLNNVVITEIDE